MSDEQVAIARQKALRLPIWFAVITSCGWYIGGLLIPPVIYIIFRDPKSHLLDFMLAHCVCGLIALAYSTCGELYIVLRVLYPAMWQDVRNFTSTARVELAPMSIWLNVAQFLAGSIPLAAADLHPHQRRRCRSRVSLANSRPHLPRPRRLLHGEHHHAAPLASHRNNDQTHQQNTHARVDADEFLARSLVFATYCFIAAVDSTANRFCMVRARREFSRTKKCFGREKARIFKRYDIARPVPLDQKPLLTPFRHAPAACHTQIQTAQLSPCSHPPHKQSAPRSPTTFRPPVRAPDTVSPARIGVSCGKPQASQVEIAAS